MNLKEFIFLGIWGKSPRNNVRFPPSPNLCSIFHTSSTENEYNKHSLVGQISAKWLTWLSIKPWFIDWIFSTLNLLTTTMYESLFWLFHHRRPGNKAKMKYYNWLISAWNRCGRFLQFALLLVQLNTGLIEHCFK